MARTGATYGKTVYIPNDLQAVYASFLIKIDLNNDVILNRYYWHFAQSNLYWDQANKLVSTGGQPQFNTTAVSRVVVPVPPLEVQSRIVSVLDNFDAVCNDLQIGLPAELDARRKQYEYYRDLLLNFNDMKEGRKEGRKEDVAPQLTSDDVKLLQFVFGVVWVRLGDVCKTLVPKCKVKSHDYLSQGKYPVIDQGQAFIAGYTNEEFPFRQDEYVIFGDHTCAVKYVNFPFVQGADGVKVIAANLDIVLPKYLFYCMTNIRLESSYQRHWAQMKEQTIPIVSLEVQRRIVSILDRFDALCNDLTAGLPAEIEARKKQYEHYRDRLLTFPTK